MLYLDTSVLVAVVSRERATERTQKWLGEQTEPLEVSDWSLAEFASAVAAKQRTGELTNSERADATRWLSGFSDAGAVLWPISRANFRRTVELVNVSGAKVRASDALHLAVAEERGSIVCTLDAEQARAGREAAIATLLL